VQGFFFSVVQAVKLEIVVAAAWERVNNMKEGKARQKHNKINKYKSKNQ